MPVAPAIFQVTMAQSILLQLESTENLHCSEQTAASGGTQPGAGASGGTQLGACPFTGQLLKKAVQESSRQVYLWHP